MSKKKSKKKDGNKHWMEWQFGNPIPLVNKPERLPRQPGMRVFSQLSAEEKEEYRKRWFTGPGDPNKKVKGWARLVEMRYRIKQKSHQRWLENRARLEELYKREEGGINLDRWARWAIQDEDVDKLDLSYGGALRFLSDYDDFYKKNKFKESNVFIGIPIVVRPKQNFGLTKVDEPLNFTDDESKPYNESGVKVYGTEEQEKSYGVPKFRKFRRQLNRLDEVWRTFNKGSFMDIEYDIDRVEREYKQWYDHIKKNYDKRTLQQFLDNKRIPYQVWFRVRYWRKKKELADLRDYMYFGAVFLEDWIEELNISRVRLMDFAKWREKKIEALSTLEEDFWWEAERYRGRMYLYYEALNDELRFVEVYIFALGEGEDMIKSQVLDRWSEEDRILLEYSGLPKHNHKTYLWAAEVYWELHAELLRLRSYLYDFEIVFGLKNKYFAEVEKWHNYFLIVEKRAYVFKLRQYFITGNGFLDKFVEFNIDLMKEGVCSGDEGAENFVDPDYLEVDPVRQSWPQSRVKILRDELEVTLQEFMIVSGLGWNPGVHDMNVDVTGYEEEEDDEYYRVDHLMADVKDMDYAVRDHMGRFKSKEQLQEELGDDSQYAPVFDEDLTVTDADDFIMGMTEGEFDAWSTQ